MYLHSTCIHLVVRLTAAPTPPRLFRSCSFAGLKGYIAVYCLLSMLVFHYKLDGIELYLNLSLFGIIVVVGS
ncbi:hypothetical protein QR685DRAFT_528911 [Neurospora intermedia]|uniref:Uncharacterized protein n=1 Tax=Neurospora intermedia TaxID=5142 RepID=A0ABR3D832_NEUIN